MIIRIIQLFTTALILALSIHSANAQFGPPGVDIIDNAREAAPFDITGNWVSIVNEDWRYRMLTAEKGDAEGFFLTDLGRREADSWDPATDEANGEACKAYGAAGIMRQPTRLQISWESDNVLRIDTDAGRQTRLLKFADAQDGAGAGTWQGISNASWILRRPGRNEPAISGSIMVETHDMRSGYLRRNGIPYSDQTTMQEYFDIISEEDGADYLVVLSVVEDPVYLLGTAITSSTFRREPNDSLWQPTDCLTQ
jgi:hypothetical protein